MHLDLARLRAEFQFVLSEQDEPVYLELPLPDGGALSFHVWEASVMEPELQERYPQIRCFTGRCTDNPRITLKCDLTPQGFHAMIHVAEEQVVFIDPYAMDNLDNYVIYNKKDFVEQAGEPALHCAQDEAAHFGMSALKRDKRAKKQADKPEAAGDCSLRRYRLALACTGEYATFHGGTKALALAAMNTTMNRVNGVYERDLAITMSIVAKNDTLIFLNGNNDPYTNNNESAMLPQNVSTCNQRIGFANYDIGHVFGTGGGGIAGLGVVCSDSKARGATGRGQPIGDPFDIDYVAHEIGHQFGAQHTFNGTEGACDGNSEPGSEIEPGSGSTIMSYAGICGSQNIQNNSHDYFHLLSLLQIGFFVTQGSGNNCPVKTSLSNQRPTVEAGSDRFIPRGTPFTLTATGTDPDGDPLTYCWEQIDLGLAPVPPNSTSTTGALFRSFPPTASPSRTFPRLSDLLNNVNPVWEELPAVARPMNFACTVRDNKAGGACTDEDALTLTVVGNAGPFVVTQPNTNVIWTVGETRTVLWDVAKTDLSPINCARVRITLSTNGGQLFDRVLAENVANDGSADIIVPDAVSNTCRVRVEAINNVFFDLSNVNFRIQQVSAPSFLMTTPDLEPKQACTGDTLSIPLTFKKLLNFNGVVKLSASGIPTGVQAVFTPDSLTPDGNATLRLYNFAGVGNFTLNIIAASGNILRNILLPVEVLPGIPETVQEVIRPLDGENGVPVSVFLKWQRVPFAAAYTVELSQHPAFTNGALLSTQTVSADSALVVNLAAGKVYYWRVKGINDCGSSTYSPIFAFQTANGLCNQSFSSSNVPLEISDFSLDTVTSVLNITDTRDIQDINVHVKIDHSWVGDVAGRLIAPGGTSYILWDRPGVPADEFGCGGADIDLNFDDETLKTAVDLELFCDENTSPSLRGSFQPIQSLVGQKGKKATGNWTLVLTDAYEEDGGALTEWGLTFCFSQPNILAKLLKNNTLELLKGETKNIGNGLLQMETSGTAAQGVFTLLSTPKHGDLTLNTTVLQIGDTFTQADIDGGKLAYTHHATDTAKTDLFRFDVYDNNNTAWLHNAVFNINITVNSLIVSAEIGQAIKCNNGTDGSLKATASGGKPPYQYSLNGGQFQNDDTFFGLAAGTYTVTVKDADGRTKEAASVSIINPPLLQVNATVVQNTLTAAATGGTGTIQFSLNGAPFQTNGNYTNLANGPYTLIARDANGCTASTTATIAFNTLVINAETLQTIKCHNNKDGIIKANVSGGKTPYQYSLNGGTFQSSNSFGGLGAGNYTIVVKDADGFTQSAASITLTNPELLQITATVNLNTIIASASGGTGLIQYSLNGGIFQSSGSYNNLANATYSIIARDANGCTASTTATIAVNTLVVNAEVIQTVKCHDGKDGSIKAFSAGGKIPYQYSLNGGNYQSSDLFGGLAPGVYTVTVKDADGFTRQAAPINLGNPPLLEASAAASLNVITASATGGTGSLRYSLNGGAYQSGNSFTKLENATYTVTVQDANGCTATATATVNVPILGATTSTAKPISCFGGNDGSLSIQPSGGVPPYYYSLNGGAETRDSIFNNLNVGPHSVTVRDEAGKIFTISNLSIQQPDAYLITITVRGNDITVIFVGNNPPYSFETKGLGKQTEDLPNGSYTLIATDGSGCSQEIGYVVDYTPADFDMIGERAKPCDQNYRVTINPQDGLPPYQYSANGTDYQKDSIFNDVPAGIKTFYLKDDAGTVLQKNINLPDVPVIEANAQVNGDTIFVNKVQGLGLFTYSLDSVNFQTSPVFPDLAPGVYRVFVRDALGCVLVIENVKVILAIVEPASAWGLRVSPNPGNGLFRLSFAQSPKTLSVLVLDALGRQLHALPYSPAGNSFDTYLDLRSLPSGTYWLRISDGTSVGGVRVVKE